MSGVKRTGTLQVPGAALFYEMSGSGPALLISDNGGGESRRRADVIAELGDAFTVITYDRRGFHRSPLDPEPVGPVSHETHADDAHRLLTELGVGPAVVFGVGLGVVTALLLATRHPEQAATVIAHTPHAPFLLPEPERSRHIREFEGLAETYRTGGLVQTIVRTGEFLGIDVADQRRGVDSTKRGPGAGQTAKLNLRSQVMSAERTRNFEWLYVNEIPAACTTTLDVGELITSNVEIIAAVGESTPAHMFGSRCAAALAELLGREVFVFEGGYNPHITHPVEFASQLRSLLGRQPA
ncbi:alpha/beta fold hydrolase [Nocardia sp. CA-135953]|uniref:alpha/beta fold hydrolase n=1 Tax=Nocardia sp. CA-135953 TaxID=3239978 RepID=UPI003D9A0651